MPVGGHSFRRISFTSRKTGENYRKRLGSLLLCLCGVFLAL